ELVAVYRHPLSTTLPSSIECLIDIVSGAGRCRDMNELYPVRSQPGFQRRSSERRHERCPAAHTLPSLGQREAPHEVARADVGAGVGADQQLFHVNRWKPVCATGPFRSAAIVLRSSAGAITAKTSFKASK